MAFQQAGLLHSVGWTSKPLPPGTLNSASAWQPYDAGKISACQATSEPLRAQLKVAAARSTWGLHGAGTCAHGRM